MTLHHAPECPRCHQHSIVRSNFHDWECVNCGFHQDASKASRAKAPKPPNPVFGLVWAIATLATVVTLIGGLPALPFRITPNPAFRTTQPDGELPTQMGTSEARNGDDIAQNVNGARE